MHDIKLEKLWRNEAGQAFAAGVMLRVSLALAHRLVAEGYATPLGGDLPPLPPPAPAVAAPPQVPAP